MMEGDEERIIIETGETRRDKRLILCKLFVTEGGGTTMQVGCNCLWRIKWTDLLTRLIRMSLTWCISCVESK